MNILLKFFQILLYFFLIFPVRLCLRTNNTFKYKLDGNKKYILVSNHKGYIDFFYIFSSINLKTFLKLSPIRFIVLNKYMDPFFLGSFLKLLGCISTKPKYEKTLEICKKLLNKKETIVIFPRGGLDKNKLNEKPKVGAIYLEKNVENSYIIPLRIAKKVLFLEPFRHEKIDKDLQPTIDNLMKKIDEIRPM